MLQELSGEDEEQAIIDPTVETLDVTALLGDVDSNGAQQGVGIQQDIPTEAVDVPQEVLLLVLSQLQLRDCVAASMTCKHWHYAASTSQEIWLQIRQQILGNGWHKQPHQGA